MVFRRLKSIIFFLIALLLLSSGVIVVDRVKFDIEHSFPVDEIFPCPEEIVAQVKFWEKIFSRYNSSQVLIHDAWELDRIYEVVDFINLYPDKKLSNYVKWRTVLQIKNHYVDELLFLDQHPDGYPERVLSPIQARLKKILENDKSPYKYRRAAENVRIQFGLSDRFKNGIETLGKYRPYMVEIFNRYELPLELLAIPLYESSFVLRALSFVNAAGVWQFMPGTARLYMRVNDYVDERYDPLIATEAAAKLLTYNYKHSGSWPLAITSYNHGLMGMIWAKQDLGTNDIGKIIRYYKSPTFGFASRNFYPEFVAAKHCLNEMYNLYNNIQFAPTWEFITVELSRPRTLANISSITGVPVKELYEYNPSFRTAIINSIAPLWRGYQLRLPNYLKDQKNKINL